MKMTKKTLLAALIAVPLALGSMTTTVTAAEPTLKVATNPNYVPFEYRDADTGEYVGFDMDIINEVAKRAGFAIDLKTMDFNGIIPALQAQQIDVAIPSITITEERAKVVDFSQPYYNSGLKLLVRADDDSITKVEDLKGKRVAAKLGTTGYDYLQEHVEGMKELTPYPDNSQMYMAVTTGNADAAFYDVPNVEYFAKTKGKDTVKAVGRIYHGEQYGIAFPKGSEWREPVDEALTAMKADGTFTKLYQKWFDSNPPEDLLQDH